MRAWVVWWVLGCAAPVLAQPQPERRPQIVIEGKQSEVARPPAEQRQPEIVIDVKQPEREWSTGVEKPPPGPGREAFDAQAISVDAILNEVKRGGKPLPASDFYRLMNRPDLVSWSEDRTRQRIWLISSGTLVAVAGVVTGIFVMGSGPDTSSPECQTRQYQDYTNCYERASKAQMSGAFVLGASLAVGGVLFVWGMNIPEMVTPADQTLKMATEYNRALAVKNGASTPSSGVRFQLLPAVAPGYAGLAARLSF